MGARKAKSPSSQGKENQSSASIFDVQALKGLMLWCLSGINYLLR